MEVYQFITLIVAFGLYAFRSGRSWGEIKQEVKNIGDLLRTEVDHFGREIKELQAEVKGHGEELAEHRAILQQQQR
jgi:hypothetical protein